MRRREERRVTVQNFGMHFDEVSGFALFVTLDAKGLDRRRAQKS